MPTRQERRLRRQYEEQIRLERNGAPTEVLYPKISARMTKPAPTASLWQVWVKDRERGLIPAGPAGNRAWAEEYATVINTFIAAGREKQWLKAEVFQVGVA